MSQSPGSPPGPPFDSDEESRYQTTCALDPERREDVTALLRGLTDPSWRVRMAAVERLGGASNPAPFLSELLEILCSELDPGARNAAASALTRLGAVVVSALLEQLGSPSPENRCAVIEVLGELRDRRSVPPLSERLEDPDPNVRSAAAESLGKIGGPEAVRALLRAVGGHSQGPRLAALDALDRLRVMPPVKLLGELARDRALRRPAYRLLGLSNDPEGYAILAKGTFESSRSCRETALAAIGQQCLRSSRARLGLLAQAVREASGGSEGAALIAPGLGSDDLGVAAGAIRVIGWIGDLRYTSQLAAAGEVEDLRPMVLEALQDMGPGLRESLGPSMQELSPGARVTVLLALARLGDASIFDELVEALRSEYDIVRSAAIEGLSRLGDLRAVPPLVGLLGDPDDAVAGSAAAALAAMASLGEAEQRQVLECCREAQSHPTAAMVRLIGQVGDSGDIPALVSALRNSNAETRAAAAAGLQALCARGLTSGYVPELLEALADPAPTVRAAAAQALGEQARSPLPSASGTQNKEVARELAANLHDGEPLVQAAAAQALGRCRLAKYAGALVELAVTPRSAPEVAAAAVRALAEIGEVDPAILEQVSHHRDAEVVKEVVWAASAVAGEAALQILVNAAGHPRWDVRRTAAQAFAARGDRSTLELVERFAASEEDPIAAEAFGDAVLALKAR